MTTAAVTTHLITDLLKHEHSNVTYLKQEGISLAISKALTQTYLHKPTNPIDFFAKSLLSQVKTKRARHNVIVVNNIIAALFSKLRENAEWRCLRSRTECLYRSR
jgi:BarA-like signal transduction histidine kinase